MDIPDDVKAKLMRIGQGVATRDVVTFLETQARELGDVEQLRRFFTEGEDPAVVAANAAQIDEHVRQWSALVAGVMAGLVEAIRRGAHVDPPETRVTIADARGGTWVVRR
ncbi:MAG TPA: hypothetical protein VHH11_14100 [Gammaproteobacteria bacterium]|nr:hypothetical protein [Gammaproteobacteria bacterium]